ATPRPMPVLPSSSRLRIARMMSSRSAPRNSPALRRLSTMARMTPSLVVADSDGMIASRTTKSDMRMTFGLRSLLGGPTGLRAGSHLAGRGGPATVLDLFLVAADLALDLVQGQVDRSHQVRLTFLRDKVVLVFGLDDELDVAALLFGL